ncbi:hypothetical protein CHH79_18735, partial [Bacillus siamensis]
TFNNIPHGLFFSQALFSYFLFLFLNSLSVSFTIIQKTRIQNQPLSVIRQENTVKTKNTFK